MSVVTKENLLAGISPPLDSALTDQLLSEYISEERRYILGDWEPATLDGGQFVEAAARIIYHQDSGKLDRRKKVDDCLRHVEEPKAAHKFRDRKSALHIAKVLRTVYNLRSDRGAVHIDPAYTANQLDAKLVIENCRWVLSEILRIFWSRNRQQVSKAIRELLQYEVPAVGRYGDKLLVERRDCTAEEETLLLLYYSGEAGHTRTELGRFIRKGPSKVTEAIRSLERKREVINVDDSRFRLTALGTKRVLSQLPNKLRLP